MLQNIKPDTLFSFIDETEETKKKKSSIIKNLSTGIISYTKLYHTSTVDLKTRAKLVICSNHPLNFTDDDDAIRDRILYFKFNRKFSEFTNAVGTLVDGVTVEKGCLRFLNCITVFYVILILLMFTACYWASKMTDAQKSLLFLVFAGNIKAYLEAKTMYVPTDILTKDQLVNFQDFVEKNFQRKPDFYVTKKLLHKKFHNCYPDFMMTSEDIVKGIKKLPADWNISYEKSKRYGDGRGVFLGLYSPDEPENVVENASRDMELEKLIMDDDSDSYVGGKRPISVNVNDMMIIDADNEVLSDYSSDDHLVKKKKNNKKKNKNKKNKKPTKEIAPSNSDSDISDSMAAINISAKR